MGVKQLSLHQQKCLIACDGILKPFQAGQEFAFNKIHTGFSIVMAQNWPTLKEALMQSGAHYWDICFKCMRSRRWNAFWSVYWFFTLRMYTGLYISSGSRWGAAKENSEYCTYLRWEYFSKKQPTKLYMEKYDNSLNVYWYLLWNVVCQR